MGTTPGPSQHAATRATCLKGETGPSDLLHDSKTESWLKHAWDALYIELPTSLCCTQTI